MGRHKGIKCSCWHTSWRKSNLYWHKIWKRDKLNEYYLQAKKINKTKNSHLTFVPKKKMWLLLYDHWLFVKFKEFCPSIVVNAGSLPIWGVWSRPPPEVISFVTYLTEACLFILLVYNTLILRKIVPHQMHRALQLPSDHRTDCCNQFLWSKEVRKIIKTESESVYVCHLFSGYIINSTSSLLLQTGLSFQ